MRYALIAAMAVLAGCQSPVEQAAAICDRRGDPPGCYSQVYTAILQSRATTGAGLMAVGSTMMAAGQPQMFPASQPYRPPVICRTLGAGAVICN